MTITEYRSVEDVYAAARQIRDRLSEQGEKATAVEIEKFMKTFWTTASEALDEMIRCLLNARPTVEKTSDKETLQLLDSAVVGATKLFNTGG